MAAYIASRSPAVDLVTPIARIRWLAPRVIGSHFDPSFVLSLFGMTELGFGSGRMSAHAFEFMKK